MVHSEDDDMSKLNIETWNDIDFSKVNSIEIVCTCGHVNILFPRKSILCELCDKEVI